VAAAGIADWNRFEAPTPGYVEQVFHHNPTADEEGQSCVELVNPGVGLTLRWTYRQESLPHLFQWKMMGEGAYVLGIEPANSSGIDGRAAARETGDLPVLAPGESQKYDIVFEIVEHPAP
jgi:hypothetical protein